jgi:UDP-N-acetylglucosamine 2-epimerase (non-hydrolysing)/GDP/UDP-N,N'-diacetylbacillosamine 2-epimerase (hydrolysing)
MAERKIVVVTGTRAEYGLLKSSMEEIRDHDELSLSVVAAGMHLSPQYGQTVTEIRDDGFTVDREVAMLLDTDTGKGMAKSLGIGIESLSETFDSLSPDFVLVLGDRDEALAAGVTAAHMNIPVAHIHGGDAMEGAVIDDSIRHALTKFAHIHFPASEKSAERIRRLGEEPWRITTVGAPGLDDVLAGDYDDPEEVLIKYQLDSTVPLILIVQHPLTTEPLQAGDQMTTTLDALSDFSGQVVLIYPNADSGGKSMIEAIESHKMGGNVRTFQSLPRREYLGLMSVADVIVGNSSSGIIEAPSFGLPTVDIGPRQAGREHTGNALSVSHNETEIKNAINRALTDEDFQKEASRCENPYDSGGAASLIVQQLVDTNINKSLLQKQITY